eukprot:INCI8292.3.p1 GENE.INCI8292.3~~INCI8292.3.p1  ORF type:complete len:1155 (-),score=205.10 INCI8292.3:1588-5052(-)
MSLFFPLENYTQRGLGGNNASLASSAALLRKPSLFGTRVPAEVLHLIFAHCVPTEIAQLSSTCCFFAHFCRRDELWLPLYRRVWGEPRTNAIDRRLSMFQLFARRHARRFLKRHSSYCAVYAIGGNEAIHDPSISSSSSNNTTTNHRTTAANQARSSAKGLSATAAADTIEDKVIFAHKLGMDVLVSCTSRGRLSYYEIHGTGNLFDRASRGRSLRFLRTEDIGQRHLEYMRKMRVQEWKKSLNMQHKNKALMALKLSRPTEYVASRGMLLPGESHLVKAGVGVSISDNTVAVNSVQAQQTNSADSPKVKLWKNVQPKAAKESSRHAASLKVDRNVNAAGPSGDDVSVDTEAQQKAKPWWSSMASKRSEKRLRKKMLKKERQRKKADAKVRQATSEDVPASTSTKQGPKCNSTPAARTPSQTRRSRLGRRSKSGIQAEVENLTRPPMSKSPIQLPAQPVESRIALAQGCTDPSKKTSPVSSEIRPSTPPAVVPLRTVSQTVQVLKDGVKTTTTTTTTSAVIPASPLLQPPVDGAFTKPGRERYMPRRRRERSFSGETSDSSSRSQIFQKDRLSSFASDDGTTSDSSYSAGTGANLVDSDLVEQSLFANDEFEQYASMSQLARQQELLQQRTPGSGRRKKNGGHAHGSTGSGRKLSKKEKRSQRKAYKQQQSQQKFEKWRAKSQAQLSTKGKRKKRREQPGVPTPDEVTATLAALGFPTSVTPGDTVGRNSNSCSNSDSEELNSNDVDDGDSSTAGGGMSSLDLDGSESDASASGKVAETQRADDELEVAPVLHRVNVDGAALEKWSTVRSSETPRAAAFDMTVVLKSGEAFAFDVKQGANQKPKVGLHSAPTCAGEAAGLHFPSWVNDKRIFRLYYAHKQAPPSKIVDDISSAPKLGGPGARRRRRLIGFTATAIHAWEDTAASSNAARNDVTQQFHRHVLLHKFEPGTRVSCARVQYGVVFFSVLRSGVIQLLDAFSGTRAGVLRLNSAAESIQTMQVGEYKIVGGTMWGCLYVWARSDLTLLFRQDKAHAGPISTLAFDKYEHMPMLMSGGADGIVKVWKLSAKPSSSGRSSFSFLKALRGHKGCIVALRADIHKIVSTDVTGEVKLWDLDGPNLGRSLRTLRCDPRAAHVLLLPNVYQIITSHPDGGSSFF